MQAFIERLETFEGQWDMTKFLISEGWRPKSGAEAVCYIHPKKKFCVKFGEDWGIGSVIDTVLSYQGEGGKVFTPILHFNEELGFVIVPRLKIPRYTSTLSRVKGILGKLVRYNHISRYKYYEFIRCLELAFSECGYEVNDLHFANFILKGNKIEIFDYGCLNKVGTSKIRWSEFWKKAAKHLDS